uniref:Uncharacterized protein n=1 Tax=Anopheles coluzzii TaxID=1518534 RepID=A0A8W7PY11_ANOCL
MNVPETRCTQSSVVAGPFETMFSRKRSCGPVPISRLIVEKSVWRRAAEGCVIVIVRIGSGRIDHGCRIVQGALGIVKLLKRALGEALLQLRLLVRTVQVRVLVVLGGLQCCQLLCFDFFRCDTSLKVGTNEDTSGGLIPSSNQSIFALESPLELSSPTFSSSSFFLFSSLPLYPGNDVILLLETFFFCGSPDGAVS